ncbi:MAG TPA: peptide ABC transporter substrate-binding protein [Actinoplanes sp.]|nr:peptide ABC transporter substrate-binding protein [Actinoplanes sp.]
MALYRNPADKRVFVPRKGGGVALNFAHPSAWWIFISMTVIPVVIVVAVVIALLV